MARWVKGGLWLVGSLLAGQAAAEDCTAVSAERQQRNDNNAIIMLGGTSQGPIKQFVVGEFGKDVNVQKRLLGQFDRCGALTMADMTYDKQEGPTRLRIVQKIVRVSDGWQAAYDVAVSVLQAGKVTEVSRKQGEVSYLTNASGAITSATDAFMLHGEKGFTTTVFEFDRQRRLAGSMSRGTDALSNDRIHYRWSAAGKPVAIEAEQSHTAMRYDDKGRELRMVVQRSDPFSLQTTVDECQLWDDRGNCTLSYTHETEVRNRGIIVRNLAAGYRFEYWDQPAEPAAP